MRPLDSGGTGNPHLISSAHSKDSHLLSSAKYSSGTSHRSSSRSTSYGDDRRESRRDTSSHASTEHQAPKPIKIATAEHHSSDSATHSSSKSSANRYADDGRESRRTTHHVSSHKSKGSSSVGSRDRSWESGLPDRSKLRLGHGGETRTLSHKETTSSQGSGHSQTRERDRSLDRGPDKSKLHVGNGGETRTLKSEGTGSVASRDGRLERGPDKSKLRIGEGGKTHTLNHNGNSSRQSSSGNVGSRDRSWESGLPDKSKLRLGYGGETRTLNQETTSSRGAGHSRTRERSRESGPDKSKLHLGYGGETRTLTYTGTGIVGSRNSRWSGLPDKSKLHLGYGGSTQQLRHNGNSSRQSPSRVGGTRDRSWESGLPDKSKLRLGNSSQSQQYVPKPNSFDLESSRDWRAYQYKDPSGRGVLEVGKAELKGVPSPVIPILPSDIHKTEFVPSYVSVGGVTVNGPVDKKLAKDMLRHGDWKGAAMTYLLDASGDTKANGSFLSAAGGAYYEQGKVGVAAEASLFNSEDTVALGGASGNELSFGLGVGVGGNGESYLGEDSDGDGYKEFGGKIGYKLPFGGSLGYRVEPEYLWNKAKSSGLRAVDQLNPFN
jgi:hypothetical protein